MTTAEYMRQRSYTLARLVPVPARAHMPFPGHRTVSEFMCHGAAAGKKAAEYGFEG